MIHVDPQPEPPGFDATVRKKGLASLARKGVSLYRPLPPKTTVEPHWRACLDDLYRSYRGQCAYLGVFFERVTGGGTVDHFVAKSAKPSLAYEWSNYRLACSIMNSRKRDYENVLDPFEIENGWFQLELVTGYVFPDRKLPAAMERKVQNTIDRLNLNDSGIREMRTRHYQGIIDGEYTVAFLKKYSPFVWNEANRQGIL